MFSKGYKALRLVGGRRPFYRSLRGSYALVGTTGPGRPFWVKQVSHFLWWTFQYLLGFFLVCQSMFFTFLGNLLLISLAVLK